MDKDHAVPFITKLNCPPATGDIRVADLRKLAKGLIMAQKMLVVLEDDIDGSEAVETVAFTVDGVAYEIDLNTDHAQQLRDAFAPWLASARRVGGRRSTRRATSTSANHLAEVRAWAKEQGLQVAERGRVSQDVQDAYRAAHAG